MNPLIAVVDVETTGLFPSRHDRVLELAVVVIRPTGQVVREFSSLVNPGRDVGPRAIHGIGACDVVHAPSFADVSRQFLDVIEGCVAVAAHNLRFDHQFLASEFERLDIELPSYFGLCTMRLAGGGRLVDCCAAYGHRFSGLQHSALDDARAAGKLLASLLARDPMKLDEVAGLDPIRWPRVSVPGKAPMTRGESQRQQETAPSFLERILPGVHGRGEKAADDAVLDYCNLLDCALEDRLIEKDESDALVECAMGWGLSRDEVAEIHNAYLRDLVAAAGSDGAITRTEKEDLQLVARLLGISAQLEGLLKAARSGAETANRSAQRTAPELEGKTVCFTGELRYAHRGEAITRDCAQALAESAGLVVAPGVSKKLDLLVASDPLTQSSKAQKARQYGVRIVQESVFWAMLGLEVT